MPDPGDGASDSERKSNGVLSVRDGENHMPKRFAVLGDLLLILGLNPEYCGDFAKIHLGLWLLCELRP